LTARCLNDQIHPLEEANAAGEPLVEFTPANAPDAEQIFGDVS
jgi:hypothetical protein